MSYLDKYKGQGERNSVYDILSLDQNNKTQWENVIKPKYVADGIEKVVIGGNTFTNYGDFQFVWEKSYVKSPDRSADGSIGNLNSYSTFVTPHLTINFGVMSIDDYRRIMLLDLESNEFVVECYDPIYNKKFKGKMYFATPQMAKLFKLSKVRFDGERWEDFVELVGVQEYTVELIGTNSDLELVSVRYIVNPPAGQTPSVVDGGEEDIYRGEEIIIGSNTDIPTETFGGDYKFKNWVDENGQVYLNGYVYTVNQDLVLYAQWESSKYHTLTFNYGVADPVINEYEFAYETSRSVYTGVSIGNLPVAETPTVKAKDVFGVEKEYAPYINGAWYKTPIKAPNSVAVENGTPYWADRDVSLYLLYDKSKYSVWYFVDGAFQNATSVAYDEEVALPVYVQSGRTFDGWYLDNTYTKKFSGKMPPYAISLYARWIDQ